ncbi:MAG TPA: hypothetical protein ENI38_01000 [Candidatus Acetothermia bacterium]|nr:hypothetical protein [Candidatus Acetothermia bacterium]
MTTHEALELSLELAGFSEVPADSEVLVPGELGDKVLFAIDVGVAELLLAKELGASGVIAHHPPGGPPRLGWHQVLWRHAELLSAYGVPEEEAKVAVEELMEEFSARDHTANYNHVPAAARALGLPLVGIHNPPGRARSEAPRGGGGRPTGRGLPGGTGREVLFLARTGKRGHLRGAPVGGPGPASG